jgi:hypothetical protein
MNVNVVERGYNVAALYSPIALSRHYVENRLHSLRVDSSAVQELSGHSGAGSHRARVVVLPATNGPKNAVLHGIVALYYGTL